MRKTTSNVQQWVDTLPSDTSRAALSSPSKINPDDSLKKKRLSVRDVSIQSDECSHCSSVESVLELRKPDPEAVLLGLGFGPPHSTNRACRIPERFLQPSKILPHIDINKFLEEQGEIPILER